MAYQVGYVYHVNSFAQVSPAKGKFGICVCVAEGYFLAINTDDRAMYDCICIKVSEHQQLGQDRYVSCKSPLTIPPGADVQMKYKISKEFTAELIAKIETSQYLTPKQIAAIVGELKTL